MIREGFGTDMNQHEAGLLKQTTSSPNVKITQYPGTSKTHYQRESGDNVE